MDDAAWRPFLAQDASRFGVRRAGMDDERQAGFPRGGGVRPEQLRLARPRAVVVVEIEAGLADADDLGVAGAVEDGGAIGVGLRCRLVRMDPDRAPDVRISLGDVAHRVEFAEPGADGEHRPHARAPRPRDDLRPVLGRGVVEMAMAIDEIQLAAQIIVGDAAETERQVGDEMHRRDDLAHRQADNGASAWLASSSPAGPVQAPFNCTSSNW